MYLKSAVVLCVLSLLLGACGGGVQEVTETRTVSAPSSAVQPASTAERFGFSQAAGDVHNHNAPGSAYMWEAPKEWQEQPAKSMRLVTFALGENLAAECYVTVLPGTAGGSVANINRWRGQMGLEPVTDADIAALPEIPLLDGTAPMVVLEGSFSGMDTEAQVNQAGLIGTVFKDGESTVFVKMVGPIGVIREQIDNFKAFCASLKHGSDDQANMPDDAVHRNVGANSPEAGSNSKNEATVDDDMGSGSKDSPAPSAAPPASESGLTWTAPDGWEKAADRAMRVVTYTAGDAECYVTVLGGGVGGVRANLNRWRDQMGQPPLSDEDIDTLEGVNVLGISCKLLDARGSYSGKPNQMLLGVVCERPDNMVFVKMLGSEEVVQAQKKNFVAFCQSLTDSE